MKFMLPLLGLLLLTVSNAQKDVDVEGFREVILKLIKSGEVVTADSLSSVATSFAGMERELLNKYIILLKDANEPEELYLRDEIADLTVFRDVLYNLKTLGTTINPKVAEALLKIIGDPSTAVLSPVVEQWKKAGTVTLDDEPKKSIDSTINAIREVIQGTDNTIRQRLKQKISSLPAGMTKSILLGVDKELDNIAQLQGGSFSFFDDEQIQLNAAEVKVGSDMVNKVVNREVILFVSNSMKTMTRAQAKLQVEILLRKIYDNKELPATLEAIVQVL